MLVKDIMTPSPVCCTPDTPLSAVARLLAEHDCGAVPVVQDRAQRQPVGIVTDRDIVVRTLAVGKDPVQLRAQDCMSAPCVTVAPESTMEICCEAMEVNQVRRLLVVDEDGRCCGIVAQADVAQAVPEMKAAEVVKEISHRVRPSERLRDAPARV